MSRVIQSKIHAPKICPPGLVGVCENCTTTFVTGENETAGEFKIIKIKHKRSGLLGLKIGYEFDIAYPFCNCAKGFFLHGKRQFPTVMEEYNMFNYIRE